MKNDYPELNFDMEHLLQNKRYEDLTPEELNEISDFISSKEDYTLMQNTFLSVKTSLEDEEEIVPAEDTRSKLMEAFEAKHGKVISIKKTRPFYLHPMFQVGVAAVFIIGILFFYPATQNDDAVTAMNEKKENPNENDGVKGDVEEESTDVEDEAAADASESREEEMSSVKEERKEAPLKSETTDEIKAAFLEEEKPRAKVISSLDDEILEKAPAKDFIVDITRDKRTDADKTMKNEKKAEAASAGYKADEDVSVSYDNNTLSTGGVAAFSNPAVENVSTTTKTVSTTDLAKADKKTSESDKAAKEKNKEGDVRTNSIGGRYYQPATPMDAKVGVSLSEKPELASFLFTAL